MRGIFHCDRKRTLVSTQDIIAKLISEWNLPLPTQKLFSRLIHSANRFKNGFILSIICRLLFSVYWLTLLSYIIKEKLPIQNWSRANLTNRQLISAIKPAVTSAYGFRWTQYVIFTGAPWVGFVTLTLFQEGGIFFTNSCFARLSSLLGTWGAPIGECRWNQSFFCNSCAWVGIRAWFPTIKWLFVKSTHRSQHRPHTG